MKRLAPLLVLAACGSNPYEARVEGIRLADADKTIEAKPGPTVKLTLDDLEPAIPQAPAARLVIARDVSWARVQSTLGRFEAAGVEPVILVGSRGKVGALDLSEEISEQSIHLTATSDGKFCVGPPTTGEARCTKNQAGAHIPRNYVREEIRAAVKAYELTDVDVVLDGDLWWVDVVHAIDGARTCCKGTTVKVKIVG
jgi:hypothetical protein